MEPDAQLMIARGNDSQSCLAQSTLPSEQPKLWPGTQETLRKASCVTAMACTKLESTNQGDAAVGAVLPSSRLPCPL